MPGKNPAAELAEKMIQVLEAQRALGPGSYPATLLRLAELADGSAPAELALKAASSKPFKSRAIAFEPKNLQSKVLLAEDLDAYPRGDGLLLELLERACGPSQPTIDPAKLKLLLPTKLRTPFIASVKQRMQVNQFPPGVAAITVRRTKQLHLVKYPLPREPVAALAEDLVDALRRRKPQGVAAYPAILSHLAANLPGGTDVKLLAKAVAHPAFTSHAVLAFKSTKAKIDDVPAALAEDRDELAASAIVLEACVRRLRTETNQALKLTDAVKLLAPELADAFKNGVAQRIATRTLPPTIGCLMMKTPCLFLMEDARSRSMALEAANRSAHGGRPPGPAAPGERPATVLPRDFATAFERAFNDLAGQGRGDGHYVRLLGLRRALPFSREEFDRGLRALRGEGRFGLSATEDPSQLEPEERAAAIVEDGQWLIYVSRKTS